MKHWFLVLSSWFLVHADEIFDWALTVAMVSGLAGLVMWLGGVK